MASSTDIDAVADLALELGLDGIIATNTTISRAGLATPAGEVEALGVRDPRFDADAERLMLGGRGGELGAQGFGLGGLGSVVGSIAFFSVFFCAAAMQ